MARVRRGNPEIEVGSDEVVFIIPAELVKNAEQSEEVNPRLSYRKRQRLPDSAFALPERREYPLDTRNRARDALSRVSHYGTATEKRRVREAVKRRYPDMHVSGIDSNPVRRHRKQARIMRCPNCGNPVRVPADAKSGSCPHCGRRVYVAGR